MLATHVFSKRRCKIPAYLAVFKKKRDRHVMCPAVERWRWRRVCFEDVVRWDPVFPHSISWFIIYSSDIRRRKTMACIVWPMAQANMTAALTCHEKEEKALRIRKLKIFCIPFFCKNKKLVSWRIFNFSCQEVHPATGLCFGNNRMNLLTPQHWIDRLNFLFDRTER